MTAERPRRQRKGDRLIPPGASAQEIACDYATAPFDRAALEMNRRWGVDRLPELVSPETAAKYGSAMAKLNAAIAANDPAETAARAAVCIRGMAAMDAEAINLGHKPAPAAVWLHEHDGHHFGIVRDGGDWTTLQAEHPGLHIYTMHEVGIALAQMRQRTIGILDAVKAEFPGAEIQTIRQRTQIEEELDDEIPF